jgi:hypothetical protein
VPALVYRSLQTVGSLLVQNADFRLFVSDLSIVARQVFQDTAVALSRVAEETGDRIAPSDQAVKSISSPGADTTKNENGVQVYPSADDLGSQVAEVAKTVTDGALTVADEARISVKDKFSSQEKDTLLFRLKQAVLRLRKRPDYTESVSTLSVLLEKWATIYSRGLQDTASTLEENVHENTEADRAVRNAWSLLSSFGDKQEWDELEHCFKQVLSHKENDPEFENLISELGESFQALLTDPDFLENVDKKFNELREKTNAVGNESDLRKDLDRLLAQAQKTGRSVLNDQDVSNFIRTSTLIADTFSPSGEYVNSDLFADAINVYLPFFINAIQTIPIPRIEISTPEIDLLLENLILTPGHTVNHSSFLPYRLGVTTLNDVVVRKTHTSQIASSLSTQVTLKLDGFSVRGEEIGYWLRTHAGLLRFSDSGLASFSLDERGMDIHVDVDIAHKSLEQILSVKAVRVHIHKLDFKLRSSVFSICAWIFRPLLRPLLRKVLERQIALAITDACHAANREIVFARERLRATRIADPKDIMTFIKAVAARLTPEDDPDLYSRIGIDAPSKGVFKGRYAPGSLAKLWAEQGRRAGDIVEDGAEVIGRGRTGWRNEVFDVHAGFWG